MITLKEILKVMDNDSPICIVDDTGAYNNACTADSLSLTAFLDELDRPVKKVYLDPQDNSITIELESLDPFSQYFTREEN